MNTHLVPQIIEYKKGPWHIYGVGNKHKRIPKGQSKMDNPEKLATEGTQDEEKHNKNTTQYVLNTTIENKQK